MIETEEGTMQIFSDEYLEEFQEWHSELERKTYFYVTPAMLAPIIWFSAILIIRIKRYRNEKVRIINTSDCPLAPIIADPKK